MVMVTRGLQKGRISGAVKIEDIEYWRLNIKGLRLIYQSASAF
jgi:hypothetical protein